MSKLTKSNRWQSLRTSSSHTRYCAGTTYAFPLPPHDDYGGGHGFYEAH